MTKEPAQDRIRTCVIDIMVIGEIMKAIGSQEISGGEAIEGTWIVWLAEQLNRNASDANEALDDLKMGRRT